MGVFGSNSPSLFVGTYKGQREHPVGRTGRVKEA